MKKFLFITLLFSYSLWAKQTHILAIHSYHETYPWTKEQRTGFRETLSAAPGFYPLYSAEYLDTKRRSFDQEYEDEFVDYLTSKYKGYRFDVLYVTDDNALKFAINNREKLFPKIKIVFSGINNHELADTLPKDIYTGVYEEKDIIPNFKLIKQLFPQDNNILILGDDSTTAELIKTSLQQKASMLSSMNVSYINDSSLDVILKELKTYTGKNIILTTIGGFHAKDGDRVALKEVIYGLVHAGDFRFYSLESSFIQQGILGGHADNGIVQGSEAAKIVLQIINHPSSPLPQVIRDSDGWIFDLQALTQHNITLPDDIAKQSKFINRRPSFYHKHEDLITYFIYGLIATVFAGSSLFIWNLYASRRIILKREQDLISVSNSLNKAQEIARLGNWTWDIQANTIWWSDEIYRIFGLKPQEFKASYEAFLLCIHPDDRQLVEDAVNNTLTNQTEYKIIHRVIRMDGAERRVIEEGFLEYEDGKPLKMQGTVQDITEAFEKEEALLLQAQIFDAVQDSIIVHDLEGRFIYLNENAWKTRGYTRKEMMAMRLSELDAPEFTSGHPSIMKASVEQMKQEGHIKLQVEHMCKNGDRLPVEVYAKLITLHNEEYVLSSVRDITPQKVAQKTLEASEEKYRILVEHAMVGIYRSDLSGNILYVNKTLTTMLGFDSPAELIGQKSMLTYSDPKDRIEFIQKLSKDHFISNYELTLIDHQSNPLPILISATLDGDVLSGMIIDMREVKKSRAEIENLSKVIEQIDDSVAITDKRGVITYVNQAFCDHTGYKKEEAIGKTSKILKSGHHDTEFYRTLWATILRGDIYRETLVNRKKNGDLYYENKTITPLKDDKNDIVGFASTGKDVTMETLMHKEMERIATVDKLTGIYNRHKFEELFALESERSRRFSQPLSLILIDIDHFKSVNDTYGHDVGDEVLKTLATVVQENIRKIDIFARWGGEEFLILSPTTDLENIQMLAEKLRLAVENAPFPKVNHITISLGISTFNTEDTFTELFKRVDQGLYYAKEHGRNQVGII